VLQGGKYLNVSMIQFNRHSEWNLLIIIEL